MKRSLTFPWLAAACVSALSLLTVPGCDKSSPDTTAPIDNEEDDLPAPGGNFQGEESLGAEGDELGEEEGDRWSEPLAELPPKPELRKKCRGRGKRRSCDMVDPKPGIAAAYGVRDYMGEYRFGMEPEAVIRRLAAKVNAEYSERMDGVSDPMKQDEIRQWRRTEIDKIRGNHVKFDGQSGHRWGASIVQHDFEDDSNEEMIWQRIDDRKEFFFFKDGELWKVVRAYDTRAFEGKEFDKILEDTWKPQFGVSPQRKEAKDPRSANILLTYFEWRSQENATVRAFDLSAVQGAYVLTVLDAGVEGRIGVRLPNVEREEKVTSDVSEVIGGSDVCYDEEGNMIESRERCKEIRGF